MGKLRRNNKGQMEAQFNWIFILVVGGIIMLFFTAIVLKQKTSSEQKLSATVISDLEAIFTGASVSKGTTHLLETPRLDIELDCSRFYLGQVNKPIGKQVLFAPSRIVGTKILTWTLEWNTPFKVTNFLYLTSPEMRYIFVYDNFGLDIIESINNSLPEEMNTEFYEYSPTVMDSITDKNNYKVRIIFVGRFGMSSNSEDVLVDSTYFPSDLSYMDDTDLTALFIKHSSDPSDPIKNIFFYKKSGSDPNFVFDFVNGGASTSKSYSLDFIPPDDLDEILPSLFGAIFVDDLEIYNCVMGKAFERLNLVASVYEERALIISSSYSSQVGIKPHLCKSAIDNAFGKIQLIKDDSLVCSKDFPDLTTSSSNDCTSLIKRSITDSDGLDNLNNKLLLYSCALVY